MYGIRDTYKGYMDMLGFFGDICFTPKKTWYNERKKREDR